MPRSMVILLIVALSLLWACAAHHQSEERASASASGSPAAEVMDDGFEVPPPRDTVPAVMRAKLFHAQAILESVVLANYAQAESNAMALKRISQSGDWLAHESPAYFEFSAEFRNICDDLVNDSRNKNLQAMADDYANLTKSCVACHDFLRMERQSKDLPGRRSMGGDNSWLDRLRGGQMNSVDQGSFPVAD